ncbi:hypothetical protein D9757_006322 [Collybiopsis confluens]|uniref:Bromodomain-containing protein n=1 Tax=Collybiopsis confluens TaxID=2823264 RepID=A0A8H5M6X1_9AGAR|nr:hypothetical protein D9757_006322 [Collybiopsis confluens]
MSDAPETTVRVELNGDQAPLPSASPDGDLMTVDVSSFPPVSPATPVSNQVSADVKIDADFEGQESDARNEPMSVKTVDTDDEDALKNVSSDGQFGIDGDSNSLPPETPMDTNDASSTPTNGVNGVNGVHVEADVNMDEHTPATTPGVSGSFSGTNGDISTAHTTPNDADDDDDDKPPPAKRPRVHSDADQASIAHSATPPPPSATIFTLATPASPPPPPPAAVPASDPPSTPTPSGPSTLTVGQYRFCQSTVRTLKKLKDAGPFLRPVDPVALNIPHYPSVIKNPMDFGTIERKLTASNPVKPDPNPHNPRYRNTDEFIVDVKLIVSNCATFNGPDHVITAMGKRVEEVFDKQIKNLPPAEPPAVKQQSLPPPPRAVAPPPAPTPAPPKKAPPVRKQSTSVPTIRRSDPEPVGRPKREIHPPAPKDLPYADAPKKPRKAKHAKDKGTAEQLKYCAKVVNDLHKKQYYQIANPFYEPVDWVKLDIPTYPKIIKKPMDLSTMRRKIENHEYPSASSFYDDFKLMIRNCFTFNPAGTPVNQSGQELQRVFDEKWKSLPTEPLSDEDEDEDEEDSEDERARAIAMMESQIETIRGTISQLKSKPAKDKKKKVKQEKAPVASSSKASAAKPPKQSAPSKKKAKKAVPEDNDVLTFEQKKEISEAISKLEGSKLERVIQIIHEGVPEIRDSTEEIELEIDILPPQVLTKLYNVVIRPMKAPPPKRNRPGKGTGTGGLKRKSMDEDVEAEKIRQLEQRMALFEQGANGAAPSAARAHDSDRSSDSSSDDSSGSDSE